jgi:hypothetical protein
MGETYVTPLRTAIVDEGDRIDFTITIDGHKYEVGAVEFLSLLDGRAEVRIYGLDN